MTDWWRDLSGRERGMLLVAAALAGILVLSLGIFRPLAEWRAGAEDDARLARDGYELTAAAAAVAGGAASETVDAQAPLRQVFVSTASAAGIELVRIGSESNGQIEIQIAPVSGDVLFSWLAGLEAQHGVRIAFADIARGEEGAVNPQVLVFER
ncbi:MAG: type II secretion system protein GspM [Pseudomonadota bacterium]